MTTPTHMIYRVPSGRCLQIIAVARLTGHTSGMRRITGIAPGPTPPMPFVPYGLARGIGGTLHKHSVSRRSLRGDEPDGVRKGRAMGTRQKWLGVIVIVAALLMGSAGLGDARQGGHGGRGHGGGWHGGGGHRGGWHGGHGGKWHEGKWHGGKWHGGHGWRGPRVGIGIGLGSYWGPYWGPYWGGYWGGYWRPYAYPYAYPPVVTAPSTQLSVQPSAPAAAQPPPPVYWYYCDHARGYYPYVQQCPGGWRAVAPTPP
jgi:hypothetical protein